MKHLCWILLIASFPAYSQYYTRSEIKHAADSIMRTFLRADMFAHTECELDNDAYVYYQFENDKGKIKSAEVPRQPKVFTRGWFKGVTVWYHMDYPYPMCPACNRVKGWLHVSLDQNLDMAHAPDIGFIPDYVWERDSCRIRSYTGK